MAEDVTGEVTELLQVLIRNQCVNDGDVGSGHEIRSADVLTQVLEGPGIDLERYEPEPGRTSLVARIEGTNPDAPSLLLMGHTDVVPVSPERWKHDPFGGELIDGEVWGRGAVDMLNLTASMAVATRKLADEGFRPEGTLIYLGVADEEALGSHGAKWLVDHVPEVVSAEYVLTESGGMPTITPGGMKLPLIVAEKGSFWCTLKVTGTPGHGSQSYKVDNALVKAAEVVRRVAEHRPETRIHETWMGFLENIGFPEEMTTPLSTPEGFLEALEAYPDALARLFHACTHTSLNPTIVRGGTKLNVIPDAVEIDLDIRIVPTETEEDVRTMLVEAIGDLEDSVELTVHSAEPPSASPIDTPLYESLQRLVPRWYEGSAVVPMLTVGATDARFFRWMGMTAYGFGLFSQRMTYEDYSVMFHGDDERVDQESLRLSTELWQAVAQDLLLT
jgi:acetylornithine deacetylase/succinyl-diaminopimelate desuccinylase-like protein